MSEYQQSGEPLNVICPKCGYDKNAVVMRTVLDHDTIQEVGIDCADCIKWTHLFFINPRIRAMRQRWDKMAVMSSRMPGDFLLKREAKRRGEMFKRAFRKYNAMMRRQLELTVEKQAGFEEVMSILGESENA